MEVGATAQFWTLSVTEAAGQKKPPVQGPLILAVEVGQVGMGVGVGHVDTEQDARDVAKAEVPRLNVPAGHC